MRTRLSVLLTVAALATVAGQSDQSAPPQAVTPEFRAGANLVRVDMFPTRDGRLLTDLGVDEVEVFEDGVRQRIETFEFVDLAGPAANPARSVGSRDAARARVFIVFIDTHSVPLQRHADLRRSLLRFLDRLLLPSDIVGLMTPGMDPAEMILGDRSHMISDLANDSRWLARAGTERVDPKEFAWENCYGRDFRLPEMKRRRRARESIEGVQGLVEWLGALREERKALLLVSSGWYFPEKSAERIRQEDEVRALGETETCARERRALQRVNFDGMLNDLGKSANRANVSFYPVTPIRQGFGPVTSRRRSTEGVEAQLRRLATMTDGLVDTRTRDFDGVLQRMIEDTSAYYLLGYQSTNALEDGRYRQITVRVKRPGIKVRARNGYGGERRAAPVLIAPAKPQVDQRVTAALDEVGRFDARAPVWLRAAPWAPSASTTEGAFWLVGEMGEHTSRWTGATAEVTVLGTDNRPFLTQSFDLTRANEVFEMRVPNDGQLPAGAYSVRVRVRAIGGSDPDAHDAVRVELAGAGTGLGEPVYWRRGPAVRDEFRQTADPRFRRTERLRLEFATDVADEPSARLLDRMGRPLPVAVNVGQRSDGGSRWVTADPPLAGLAPGDYAVEVTQRGVVQITAFKVIP